MGIKEKLPLINSNSKGTRIAGYILYAFVALIVLGAILPSHQDAVSVETSTNANTTTDLGTAGASSTDVDTSSQTADTSAVLSYHGFGNYTFDGQEDVKATVKKGTDVVHLFGTTEIPTDWGRTKDGAQYTVTSTGKKVKGYIDYTGEGYVVVLQPRRSSLTKDELTADLDTFRRVE